MILIDALLGVHVGAGTVALATFLVPIVTAKGGRAHRRVGWIFVTAMAILCLTGAPVSISRILTADREGGRIAGWFLLFLTHLSAATVWKGMRVLRFKGPGRSGGPIDVALAALLVPLGAWVGYLGLRHAVPVFLFFGPFAVYGAIVDLRYWLDPAKPRMHWYFEHLGGMMGAATAALTAFSALGARALGFGGLGFLAWAGPTLVLAPVSILIARYYRRRFGLEGAVRGPSAPAGSEDLPASAS